WQCPIQVSRGTRKRSTPLSVDDNYWIPQWCRLPRLWFTPMPVVVRLPRGCWPSLPLSLTSSTSVVYSLPRFTLFLAARTRLSSRWKEPTCHDRIDCDGSG